MSTLRQQVSEFHIAMEQPIAEVPHALSEDRMQFRLRLIHEEFHELLNAAGYYEAVFTGNKREILSNGLDVNLVEVADALADLDYVIEGMRLELGINGKPIADAVHESNMSKLGDDGRPIKRYDGKVLKSLRFHPPDIAGELRRQGWKGSDK